MTDLIKFVPHSAKQDAVIYSQKRLVIAATGIQFGKTVSGAMWLVIMMHIHNRKKDNFIITSPSFPILSQSTLPPFLALVHGKGHHDKQLNCFRMYGGGTCWFRTGTDPNSVVGITDVKAILSDEAGLYSLLFWQNIQARSSFYKCPIRVVTSPYSLNWLYKDYIRPITKGDLMPDVELIQATSMDNPYFPADEYYSKQKTMESRRFNMVYGGIFSKMEGLVHGDFHEIENTCDPFPLPQGTVYYAGVDWGFTNPFALVVRGITPQGDHFQVSEHYETGLDMNKKVEIAKQKQHVWNIKTFFCDPAEPASIESFCKAGLSAVKADNTIRKGLDIHNELIKTRRYKVFRGSSPHTLNEYDVYHYPDPKDIKPDKDIKEDLPVDQDNHAMSANRYCSIMTFNRQNLHKPFNPEDIRKDLNIHEKNRILLRKKVVNYDDWN